MEVEKIKKSFGNFPFIGSINLDSEFKIQFLVFLFIFLIPGIQVNAQSSSCIEFNGACSISEAANQACQLCDFFGENRECAGFELPAGLFELPNTEDYGEIPAAMVQAIQDFPEDYAHLEGVERIYIGQRLHSLALEYPEATGKDLIRAAVVEFRSWIISQVSIARVNRFGNGSGGYEYSVQLTASRMPGSYIVGTLFRNGRFDHLNLKEAWEREQRNPGLAIALEPLAVESEGTAMEREALINELGFLLNRLIDLEGN